MAHIAIATGLLIGRIHASFALASRLQKEGHTITYLCQPSTVKRIEENGFNCEPVTEITFNYKDPRRKNMESSWFKKLLFHYKNLNSHYAAGEEILQLDAHKRVLSKLNPDLILVDVEIHDLIFTAIELQIPIKLCTTWFSDTISSKSPSIRTSIIPGKGFKGSSLGIFLSWCIMRLKINARVVLNRLTFENYRRWMFKKYAHKIGFDTRELLTNTLPPLYSFTKLPIVTMTMSELEFPHKLSKNMIYVGPMVYEKRNNSKIDTTEIEKLETIFKTKAMEHKKLVYCSVGSLAKGHLPFLKKVINAVEKESDWLMILSIGPKMKIADFGLIPKNIHLFNWVPQLQVIQQSDCCITHCGINSINECLHYNVPMLLYSGGYTDEDGNAARMAYHGLGIVGNIKMDDQKKINTNLRRVLEEDSFKKKVKDFNKVYHQYLEQKLSPLLLD